MSFYRTLLAAMVTIVIASPVFAEDTSMQPGNTNTNTNTPSTMTNEQTSTSTSSTETKVNLNKASAKELMKVKGINAAKARAIIAYRKKHNGFTSTDELSKVKGFQKMNADALKTIQDQLSAE